MHRYVIKQDYTKYLETTGVVLTCKKFLNWLRQLRGRRLWARLGRTSQWSTA